MSRPARRLVSAASALLAAGLFAGCTTSDQPTEPAPSLKVAHANAAAAAAHGGGGVRVVNMLDACDPTSFNAAIGAGTCVRNGGVKFDQFIAQLTKHGEIGAWHFSPWNRHMKVGQTLVAVNKGGEEHTFTEVEEFGGGIVPLLNQLSGNPVPAPECLNLDPDDFVPPGGTYEDQEDEAETELYQCCIHPWMRAVVTITE